MQVIWSRAFLRDCPHHVQLGSTAPKTITSLTTKRRARHCRRPASAIFAPYCTEATASAAASEAVFADVDGRTQDLDDKTADRDEKLAHFMEQTTASDLAPVLRGVFSYPSPITRPRTDVLLDWSRASRLRVLERLSNLPQFRSAAVNLKEEFMLPHETIRKDRRWGLDRCWRLIESHDTAAEEGREPKTASQLEEQAKMITTLVDRLMEAALERESVTPERLRASRSLDSPWNMLRMLRSEGYPRYIHPDQDREATREARLALNQANRKILDEWVPYRVDKALAKICHNFLVLQVPPGINNYNVLIMGLSEIGEQRLADIVVKSFYHDSRYLPTSGTSLSMLHHFRLKGDVIAFQSLIRRLMAGDDRGFLVRRRRMDQIDPRDKWVKNWVTRHSPRYVNGWLVEPPRLGKLHWEAIIQGLVRFGMLREAAGVFVSCLEQGTMLDVEYVRELFCTVLPVAIVQQRQQGELGDATMRARVAHLATLLWIDELSKTVYGISGVVRKLNRIFEGREGVVNIRQVAVSAPNHLANPWKRLDVLEWHNTRFRRLGRYLALWWYTRNLDRDLKAADNWLIRVRRKWLQDKKEWLPWYRKGNMASENEISAWSWYMYQQQLMTPGSRTNRAGDCFYQARSLTEGTRELVLEYLTVLHPRGKAFVKRRLGGFMLPLLLQAAAAWPFVTSKKLDGRLKSSPTDQTRSLSRDRFEGRHGDLLSNKDVQASQEDSRMDNPSVQGSTTQTQLYRPPLRAGTSKKSRLTNFNVTNDIVTEADLIAALRENDTTPQEPSRRKRGKKPSNSANPNTVLSKKNLRAALRKDLREERRRLKDLMIPRE
ncbi:hypothetical protein OQA88_12385 [Cercophora sp. LCS_1]